MLVLKVLIPFMGSMKFRIKYPNLTLFGISIIVAILLMYFGILDMLLGNLGSFGYLGALIAGILFPITFTSPIAAIALFYLGEHYNFLVVAGIGTIGAVLGDLIIFHLIKGGVTTEIEEIREEYKEAHPIHGHRERHRELVKLFHSRPFHALALFMGAIFILAPGPDELGIAIFASYNVDMRKFIPLSLVLNAASVLIVTWAGHSAV